MIAGTKAPSKAKPDALEWVTPDDFLVKLAPAEIAERLGALLIDGGILVLSTLVLIVALLIPFFLVALSGAQLGLYVASLFVVINFFVWNGYFIYFEWKWMGIAPGKKLVGIQVIRPHHGVLTLGSVLARGFAREVEIFLPIKILIMMRVGNSDEGALFLWCGALCLVPLLNAGRRRAGDYIAGTFVVKRPQWPELPRDVSQAAPASVEEEKSAWTFTTPMLEIYGTAQLNALQEVLGRPGFKSPSDRRLLVEIKDKVATKIDYPDPVPDAEAHAFLLAFYTTMREYLEGQLASGRSTIKTLKKSSTSVRKKGRWARFFESPE
ncbi:MAG: RDD family protein [Planctomycetota bacterium]|jgi:uncharacterized RDD family membrane protein YckC